MKQTPTQARQAAAAALLAFARKEITTEELKAATKKANAATRAAGLKSSSEHVKK